MCAPAADAILDGMTISTRAVRRASVAAAAVCALAGAVLLPVQGATAAGTTSDRTAAAEAARVDRVRVGRIVWSPCPLDPAADCATVRLPLDYDRPDGPTVAVGVARVRAAKPAQRIGTLFVNPGARAARRSSWH